MRKLKQIDQALIKLLSQRIAALKETYRTTNGAFNSTLNSTLNGAEAPHSGLAEEILLTQQLAQSGVPQFVWNSVATSCAAATTLSADRPAVISETPKQIAIIGGSGRMGRFFTRQFASAGHQVHSLGRDWQQSNCSWQQVELVLVSVPIQQTLTVIQQLTSYLTSNTALVDITSVKTPIVSAMVELHSGPILSLHPMFGAGVESFLSQNVVVCPGRSLETFQWLLDLMDNRGANLIFCTPEEHDRTMVLVQAIRNFLTLGLGVFLAETGVDINRSLELSSPPYRLQLNLVSRLLAQDATLPIEMMMGVEERRQAIGQLAATYSQLAQLVAEKDQVGLQQAFESTCHAFQSQASRALEESNHVIESLSLFLAAQEVKT